MRYRTEKEEEKEEELEQAIHLNNRVFDDMKQSLDMTKRVCTDLKCNRRVFMPKPRPVKEECCLRTRKEAWVSEWTKCFMRETNGKGNQDHHQLDKEEMCGRTSLLKRVMDGELHIGESDKGKKVVVMDMDMYYNMSIVHTQQDLEVD